MRKALPSLLLLCMGSAASAQLSLTPQIGLESSKTSISANSASFQSIGSSVMPKANFRLGYQFKTGHGPYVGFGTSPAVATISTTNPEGILNNHVASLGKTKWRFESGYQLGTKPIFFKKNSAQNKSTKTATNTDTKKSSCMSSTYRTGCSKSYSSEKAKKNDSWNMRVQPSVGLAYTQAANNEIFVQEDAGNTQYNYKAGNWNTALTAGVGFEFAKGSSRKFLVSLQHLRGLGNLNEQAITTVGEGKTTTTYVDSRASVWSLSFGIPLQLSKSKQKAQRFKAPPTQQNKPSYKSKCGSYSRCTRQI